MLVPMVAAWIEQPYHTSCAWVASLVAITFVEVAVRAGIAQVIEMGLASEHSRHNVVNVECLSRDNLRRMAIFATVVRTFRDPTRQSQGDVGHKRSTLRSGWIGGERRQYDVPPW
jgi:hypothetical protein